MQTENIKTGERGNYRPQMPVYAKYSSIFMLNVSFVFSLANFRSEKYNGNINHCIYL